MQRILSSSCQWRSFTVTNSGATSDEGIVVEALIEYTSTWIWLGKRITANPNTPHKRNIESVRLLTN
jgi:hypothetical protein